MPEQPAREPGSPPDPPSSTGEPTMRAILEALLYAAPEPIALEDLKEAFGSERAGEVEAALAALLEEYRGEGRGLAIERVAGGYRIATRPEMAGILREFVRRRNRMRLSRAALETLAVIAYHQPVTAPEIESTRGVNPSAILRTLLDRRLIRIVGRKKVVGKPFLYGTTPEFLEHFGLNTLDDLPSMDDFTTLLETPLPGVSGAAPVPRAPAPSPQREDADEEPETAPPRHDEEE